MPGADRDTARKRPVLDEATAREQTRKSATENVRLIYQLLLEDLGTSETETEDLTELLVDMNIERTWTSYQRGRTITDEERADRIAAVIGAEKLERFLALEQNGPAYWEATQIALLLKQKGVPITAAQRDGVLELVAQVHDRHDTRPPADLDPKSVEYIDRHLWQLDEFERHVIEVVPSVLSPNQVVYLFERYQGMSRARIALVDKQKQGKLAPLGEGSGWATPARWNPAR